MQIYSKFNIEYAAFRVQEKDYPINIDQLNYFQFLESIDIKGISATLSFLDYNNYSDLLPIIGGETFIISISDIFGDKVMLEFINTSKTASNKVDATFKNNVTLTLIQKEYYYLVSRNFLYGVNYKTVNEVISNMLSRIGLFPEKIFEDTKIIKNNTENISFPSFWTCDQAISYLLAKNMAEKNNCMYFYYDRTKSKFVLYSNTDFETKEKKNESFTFIDRNSFNFVSKHHIEPHQDIIDYTNQYIGDNTLISADLNKKKIHIKETSIEEYMSSNNIKHSSISAETKALDSNMTYYVYSPFLYAGQQESELNDKRTKFLRDSFKMSITISGRFNINLGDKIFIIYQDNLNYTDTIQGEWIVTSIINKFSASGQFEQNLNLARSSIKTSTQDTRVVKT